jgi:hypothetical protein
MLVKEPSMATTMVRMPAADFQGTWTTGRPNWVKSTPDYAFEKFVEQKKQCFEAAAAKPAGWGVVQDSTEEDDATGEESKCSRPHQVQE